MVEYIVKQMVMTLTTTLVVACVTLALMIPVPGNLPNDEKTAPGQKAATEARYGMDDPLGAQMLRYLKGVVVDQDSGVSLKMQKSRLAPDTITGKSLLFAKIGIIALVRTVVVGVPLSCLVAYNRGKWMDSALRMVCILGVSMSGFVVVTFPLMLSCNNGASFEFTGTNVISDTSRGTKAYLTPRLALDFYPVCYVVRLTRSSMLDTLDQNYTKIMWTKGLLTPRITFKHVLHDGVILVITYPGLLAAFTLAGGFVAEAVHITPGLGRHPVQSVQNRGYLTIMGITIFLTTLAITMNLVVNILYRVVDPRIDLAKGEQKWQGNREKLSLVPFSPT